MKAFNPDKELKKIQHGSKNKVILVVFLLLIVSTISYSFALYQVRYSKRIIYTKVAPFNNKDIELSVYLDGSPSSIDDFPVKNSGYRYDHIECDNGSIAEFNTVKWSLLLSAKKKDKCNVYFVKNNEPNVPELYQGLIPIVYDESGNISVADTNSNWYDYDDKRWANAVLVSNTNYGKYVKDGEYISNKTIPIEEILQMYVWIPRYKYQLFNAVNGESKSEQEIKIEFENGTLSTGTVECEISDTGVEICTNAANGNWYTHPAFTFGDTELLGIWVGKFDSSGNAGALTIKPNMSIWVGMNVSVAFNASRNIEKLYADTYNVKQDELDTHTIKNMEWGAMAYLTHSKYGRCGENGECTEVTMNTSTVTGRAGSSLVWNTTDGQKASTTGNIYGIYDTNGGAWDYAMSVMIDADGSGIQYLSSGFADGTMPDKKYYDLYEYSNDSSTHGRGHLGDATREILKTFGSDTGGWYNDYARLVFIGDPWSLRGGCFNNGNYAGTFAFHVYTGGGNGNQSFRLVITQQDGSNPIN